MQKTISYLLKSFYNITKPFNISKGYFNPVPNVDSALLVMENNGKYKDMPLGQQIKALAKDTIETTREQFKRDIEERKK